MRSDVPVDANQAWEIEVKGSYDFDDFRDIDFYDIFLKDTLKEKYLETGIVSFHFNVPEKATSVQLEAVYSNEGDKIVENMDVVRKYSQTEKFLNLWTTSEDLVIKDFAIFHVKINFETSAFYTLVSNF